MDNSDRVPGNRDKIQIEVNDMTPTEVLREIQKMPLSDRHRLRDCLDEDIPQVETNGSSKESDFLESMKAKGLITHVPSRKPDPEWRRNFKRITVTGEPISETIIRERR